MSREGREGGPGEKGEGPAQGEGPEPGEGGEGSEGGPPRAVPGERELGLGRREKSVPQASFGGLKVRGLPRERALGLGG